MLGLNNSKGSRDLAKGQLLAYAEEIPFPLPL